MKITAANLLEELDTPELAEFRSLLVPQHHAAGTMLCSPYDPNNVIFVLLKGRLRVYLGYEEKEFTLAILERGNVYTSHTRAFVQAVGDVDLLVADIDTFQRHTEANPALARSMINVLGRMLKNSFSIINGLVFRDASSRLAKLLLDEARTAGKPDPDAGPDYMPNSVIIEIDLTTEQMAQVVGTSRQTLSMLLNDFIRSGEVARIRRGVYRITDPKHLESRIL